MRSRATQTHVPKVIVYSGRAMWNGDAGPIKRGTPPQPPPSVRSIIAELRDAFHRAMTAGSVPKYRGAFEFMAHVAPELLEQETRRRHDVRQTEEHLKHCAKLKDVLLRAGLGQDFAMSEQVALRALAKRLVEAAYGGPPVSFDEVEAFASHLDDLAVELGEPPIGPRRWNPATDEPARTQPATSAVQREQRNGESSLHSNRPISASALVTRGESVQDQNIERIQIRLPRPAAAKRAVQVLKRLDLLEVDWLAASQIKEAGLSPKSVHSASVRGDWARTNGVHGHGTASKSYSRARLIRFVVDTWTPRVPATAR